MSHHDITSHPTHSCLDLMSLNQCHSSHVSSFRHISSNSFLSRSHVTHPMPLSDLSIPYVLLVSHLIQLIPVSISCHSSHVTHLMSHHYVTHLMSHHYITHLMSHHCVTDAKLLTIYSRVATFNFCPWPLPTSHRIILPVTSAHPLRSNLCPHRSVLLPGRIEIGLQGVSHSTQSRSHVTHLMSHHYVTEPGLKG